MKYTLLLSVLILVAGLAYLVIRWPQGKGKTFSQHAAAQRATIYFYIALFLIVNPLLAVFFYGYFIPKYELSLFFSGAIFLAIVAQFVAAFVPEVGGWKSRVHRQAAGWSAFGLFLATASIVVEHSLPLPIRIVGAMTVAFMLWCSSLTLRSTLSRKLFEHNYFLWLQVGYYALFFTVILSITYTVD